MADLQILDPHIRADRLPSEERIHALRDRGGSPFLALQPSLDGLD
jgi:hypothetical protein